MVTSYTDKYFLIPKKTSVLEENLEDGEEVCPTNDNIDYDPFSPEPAVEEQAAPRVKRRRIQNSAGHVVHQNLTLAVFFKRRFVGESSGSQVANQTLMRPKESELSQSLSSQVTDLLDHEHAPR